MKLASIMPEIGNKREENDFIIAREYWPILCLLGESISSISVRNIYVSNDFAYI